jgi:transposase
MNNRFRNYKLKGVLKEVFGQVVTLIVGQGVVDIKTIYIDWTILEVNANKYTFVL